MNYEYVITYYHIIYLLCTIVFCFRKRESVRGDFCLIMLVSCNVAVETFTCTVFCFVF